MQSIQRKTVQQVDQPVKKEDEAAITKSIQFRKEQTWGLSTHELKDTRESMGRDKSLLMKCFVFV